MDESAFTREAGAEIASDRTRGASELARRCLDLLATYAERCEAADAAMLREKLRRLAETLQRARPSMAPVQNLVGAWLRSLEPAPDARLDDVRAAAVRSAGRLSERSIRAVGEAAAAAARLIEPGATLITHSFSSTVCALFGLLETRGVHAIVTESRPLLEGVRLTRRLSELGIETRYVTDAQLGVFAAQADAAVVGADALLWDGSAVNKAGSYLLALAARDRGIPFYVCCESFKRALTLPGEVALEEMDARELDAIDLPHVTPRNVYFDLTPARLISAWATERGLCEVFRSALTASD